MVNSIIKSIEKKVSEAIISATKDVFISEGSLKYFNNPSRLIMIMLVLYINRS